MYACVDINETLELSCARSVKDALLEDLGTGDLTAGLVPESLAMAHVVVKQNNTVLCGKAWFDECFKVLDINAEIIWYVDEGETLIAGKRVCTINAQSRAILSAERPALNFLQTLSGTATQTRKYVKAIKNCSPNPNGCTVLDTRKTIPGLRLAQKYAVRVGGGSNQRLALWHGILIKENHITACGSIGNALMSAKMLLNKQRKTDSDISIQIEVETLAEFREALMHGAQSVILDDFDLNMMLEAVSINASVARDKKALNQKAAILEVSGNVTIDNISDIAKTGVDRISIGKITKDLLAVDFSLRVN